MSSVFRPDPAEFDRCVTQLCFKIESIAARAGVSEADCTDLEGTLAAMPPLVRERTVMMLEGLQIQTEFQDPAMAFAARYMLKLAEDIWEENPHAMVHAAPHAPALRKRG